MIFVSVKSTPGSDRKIILFSQERNGVTDETVMHMRHTDPEFNLLEEADIRNGSALTNAFSTSISGDQIPVELHLNNLDSIAETILDQIKTFAVLEAISFSNMKISKGIFSGLVNSIKIKPICSLSFDSCELEAALISELGEGHTFSPDVFKELPVLMFGHAKALSLEEYKHSHLFTTVLGRHVKLLQLLNPIEHLADMLAQDLSRVPALNVLYSEDSDFTRSAADGFLTLLMQNLTTKMMMLRNIKLQAPESLLEYLKFKLRGLVACSDKRGTGFLVQRIGGEFHRISAGEGFKEAVPKIPDNSTAKIKIDKAAKKVIVSCPLKLEDDSNLKSLPEIGVLTKSCVDQSYHLKLSNSNLVNKMLVPLLNTFVLAELNSLATLTIINSDIDIHGLRGLIFFLDMVQITGLYFESCHFSLDPKKQEEMEAISKLLNKLQRLSSKENAVVSFFKDPKALEFQYIPAIQDVSLGIIDDNSANTPTAELNYLSGIRCHTISVRCNNKDPLITMDCFIQAVLNISSPGLTKIQQLEFRLLKTGSRLTANQKQVLAAFSLAFELKIKIIYLDAKSQLETDAEDIVDTFSSLWSQYMRNKLVVPALVGLFDRLQSKGSLERCQKYSYQGMQAADWLSQQLENISINYNSPQAVLDSVKEALSCDLHVAYGRAFHEGYDLTKMNMAYIFREESSLSIIVIDKIKRHASTAGCLNFNYSEDLHAVLGQFINILLYQFNQHEHLSFLSIYFGLMDALDSMFIIQLNEKNVEKYFRQNTEIILSKLSPGALDLYKAAHGLVDGLPAPSLREFELFSPPPDSHGTSSEDDGLSLDDTSAESQSLDPKPKRRHVKSDSQSSSDKRPEKRLKSAGIALWRLGDSESDSESDNDDRPMHACMSISST